MASQEETLMEEFLEEIRGLQSDVEDLQVKVTGVEAQIEGRNRTLELVIPLAAAAIGVVGLSVLTSAFVSVLERRVEAVVEERFQALVQERVETMADVMFQARIEEAQLEAVEEAVMQAEQAASEAQLAVQGADLAADQAEEAAEQADEAAQEAGESADMVEGVATQTATGGS
jgi:hypothetical protein